MRKITRVALVAFAAATALSARTLAVLWFAWDPLLPAALWLARMEWFDVALLVLLAICALGVIALLVAALAAPGTRGHLVIEHDGGRISIAKGAVRSVTERTIESHRGLMCKSARIKVRGRRNPAISVRAKVNPGNHVNLAALGATLQREVATNVSALAGYPAEDVEITFTAKTEASTPLIAKQSAMSPAAGA